MGRMVKFVFSAMFALALLLFPRISRGQSVQADLEVGLKTVIDCRLFDKIDELDPELESMILKISFKKYTYVEERSIADFSGNISHFKRTITDDEKEIGLRLLNVETCSSEVIKITKRGRELIVPGGYEIRVVRRINGIEWNGRNTHFQVIEPKSTIVLRNAWPEKAKRLVKKQTRDRNGRKRIVTRTETYTKNTIYSPYSNDDPATLDTEPGIHLPEVVEGGAVDAMNMVNTAREILRSKDVRSKVFSEYTVGDLPFISPKIYARLMMNEQTDFTEFLSSKQKAAERALVIFRTNRVRAFNTCNSKKPWRACGAWQFTDNWKTKKVRGKRIRIPGTYSTVVRLFPKAQLIKSFPEGAFDHLNSVQAAILLHDLNLNTIYDEFGDQILEDPVLLELALAAAYNGGVKRVILALEDHFRGKLNTKEFIRSKYLAKETREYSEKGIYMIENNLP